VSGASADTGRAPGRPVRSVALLLNNPFLTDSRAWKMARTLGAAGYEVTVVARAQPGLHEREDGEGYRVVRVAQPDPFARLPSLRLPPGEDAAPRPASTPSPARITSSAAASVGRAVQAARYLRLSRLWARDVERAAGRHDAWQAEGLVPLPMTLELRRRAGGVAIYDSRDLDVQSARFARLPGPWRRLLERREQGWARSVDALISVSRPYAEVLERSFGRTPTIVMNGPPEFTPPDPPERRFHDRLGLAPGTPLVMYLGLVMAGRGIEQLCVAIGQVPAAVLVVAGTGADYERYRDAAAELPHAGRIHFLPGIPPDEILSWTASADISAMPVQGDTVNHRLNTPTKLFDAMGAGVPVVASDLPGMGPIVRDTGCGELCDPEDPADIARAIRTILDAPPARRAAYRDACLAAARGPYAWERQADALLGLYRGLRVTSSGSLR
jgi:glycosyltransferase involved in cell wall biosynthesis